MMTDRELMQQALEALNRVMRHGSAVQEAKDILRAALRERLAQPQRTHWEGCEEVHPECRQQEPVAWRNAALRVGEDLCSVGPFGYYDMTAQQWLDWALSVVTCHPPQRREWVGLTEAEKVNVAIACGCADVAWMDFADAVEAKLREKNA